LFFWQNVKIRPWLLNYLFLFLFICGGNVHHCGKVILKKGIFCHKYPVLWGEKNQRKWKTIFLFSKSPKNRHNCLQYEWVAIKIFYFHIWILPDLAKYIYGGWLSLEEHQKNWKQLKLKLKLIALSLSLSLSFTYFLLQMEQRLSGLPKTPSFSQFLLRPQRPQSLLHCSVASRGSRLREREREREKLALRDILIQ
jgi:hypothetical protein